MRNFLKPFILSLLDQYLNTVMMYEKTGINQRKIQIQTARVAIGATKLISINALYNDTQWEILQQKDKITSYYSFI